MTSKALAVRVSVALALVAGMVFFGAGRGSATTPPNSVSYTDPSGNVFSSTGKNVQFQEQGDAKTATVSDVNGQINVSLNTYQLANPYTDPGWQQNTYNSTTTYTAWALVTNTGAEYIAYFFTNGVKGQGVPQGTLGGELTRYTSSSQFTVSCALTPSFNTTTGYQLAFAASCLGSPTSFQWYSYIIYRPAGAGKNYFVGKDVPEETANPKQGSFGTAVYAPAVGSAGNPRQADGYDLVAKDGGVFVFGGAHFYGSTGGIALVKPVVGMAVTPDSAGYWLVASDGGVFAYGDAHFYGSTGGVNLTKPIVGMSSTPDGKGYWLVASDGGVFAFGDAHFYGSTGNIPLVKPVVGMAATGTGAGYTLVASDGGVFSFGDAGFYGSLGGIQLVQPVVGMSAEPTVAGYWMTAADGGVFAFPQAKYLGSHGNSSGFVGMGSAPDGNAYWLATNAGNVYPYGGVSYGDLTGIKLNQPVVGIAITSH